MSISIVTVVLNAAEDLALTIESVRQQDYREIEYIIVDGGSWDRTPEVLARYADVIHKVVRVEDSGIYQAMNLALDHCSRDYVLFLNAKDTLYSASALSRLMSCREPDVDVFFGNHVYVQGRKKYFKKSTDYDLSAALLLRGEIDHLWLAQLPGHQATFVRADLLRRLRFDTDILVCADHDLMMRAHSAGARFQYIDECVSHYVGGGFSAQQPIRLTLEWCALYRQYSLHPAAVDRFFLGDATSPFGPQNALTGITLSGDFEREGPDAARGIEKAINWCRPDGVLLRTSAKGSSVALSIEGFCPFDGQCLFFSLGDREVGRLELEKGWFKQFVPFTEKVPPGVTVEVAASKLGDVSPDDRRVVGYALSSYAFKLVDEAIVTLRRGDRINFTARNRRATSAILGHGWGPQEDTFVWSVGETAELRFRVPPGAESVVIRCRGNPFIEDAELRGIDISVDGRFVGRHLLSSEPCDVSIACSELSADGRASVGMRPLLRFRPPLDDRLLGVCLFSLECL